MCSKGASTLNPDSNQSSNRIAQCEFNANPMRIDRVHTALCRTEFTHACWLQVATPPHSYHGALIRSLPSYCFSSWADTWNTVCSPEKRAHCRRAYTPRPFWSLRATRNCAIQFNPDRNHLWKWIGINPDRIRIGRMRIQCGRTQTRFDPVQCALGAQCGRVLIKKLNTWQCALRNLINTQSGVTFWAIWLARGHMMH